VSKKRKVDNDHTESGSYYKDKPKTKTSAGDLHREKVREISGRIRDKNRDILNRLATK
jgi:hypothetical protein